MKELEWLDEFFQTWNPSDPDLLDRVFPLVYTSLRQTAAGLLDNWQTDMGYQATELVHTAYAKIKGEPLTHCNSPLHYFYTIGQLMRWLLHDAYRRRQARKNFGHLNRVYPEQGLDEFLHGAPLDHTYLWAFERSLQQLHEVSPVQAEIVNMAYLGFKQIEIAQMMKLNKTKVNRHLRDGRMFIKLEMGQKTC